MPTLSMFFGLIIRMYYTPKEHNPPHIHVYYSDHSATVENRQLRNIGRIVTAKAVETCGSMDRNSS